MKQTVNLWSCFFFLTSACFTVQTEHFSFSQIFEWLSPAWQHVVPQGAVLPSITCNNHEVLSQLCDTSRPPTVPGRGAFITAASLTSHCSEPLKKNWNGLREQEKLNAMILVCAVKLCSASPRCDLFHTSHGVWQVQTCLMTLWTQPQPLCIRHNETSLTTKWMARLMNPLAEKDPAAPLRLLQ